MAHLTLAGASDDGKRLLLVDDDGTEHTLDLDHALRSAVRPQSTRTGQETTMDSTLRPRDIQARIRAGETPEALAELAGTTVERIMPYAGPVLAEREHVAERAQRSSVRRRAGEPAPSARTLGEAVAAHLRAHAVDPATVAWDAWRREDGRWTLTAAYSSPQRSGTARFAFDVPGNYVTADDDDARWLVGEALPAGEPVRDDLEQVRQRRLTAIGDDAIELVRDEPPHPEPDAAPTPEVPPALGPEQTEPAPEPSAPAARAVDAGDQPLEFEDAGDTPEPEPEPAPRRSVRKRGGRASVPSWDEIMFGGGKQD